ncbi:alpha-L-rhamnosidase C-terminal domain-containing protein [uncultured Draconibacterium sp.]|uniref:alpha-L-rhamnosidase-related protein n=1 Tax=uncultured Draconibacterium sp. TaxID=1573823 RepID=UPI002AA91D07|nr:alpha-L-rhamnosidase C-terminal domain-containing protein [uncultured Draconibacterium sp.]
MKRNQITIIGIILILFSTTINAQENLSDFFAGKWDVLVEGAQSGDVRMTLVLENENDNWKGSLKREGQQEPTALSTVEINGNSLKTGWKAEQDMDINLELDKIDQNSMTGKVMGAFDVTAVRITGDNAQPSVILSEVPDLLNEFWKARWITVPGTGLNDYGVYVFRKNLELSDVPEEFPVHISADNRYKLYVNEKLVSLGPARGDINHWNYETVDLAHYLHEGKNIVAAQVWNEGEFRTEGHLSLRTAFILQGGTKEAQLLNTNSTWKCAQDKSYSPIPVVMNTFYVAGPGERIQMSEQIKGWSSISCEDNHWNNAEALFPGLPKNRLGFHGVLDSWLLMPSAIPQMELKEQRLLKLRNAEGISVPSTFPSVQTKLTIPANTDVTLLLDQTFLTNAYPTLVFSGGKDGVFTVGYQEALFSEYPEKGNRNDVEGKTLIGRVDSIFSDGSENQVFTPLNYRTYRFIELKIATKDSPLILEDISGTFTGYPFEFNAKLESDNKELQKMLEIGWRSARLCAMETYMDCPYYEQLQYIGDGRIQALVSLYNSGDDRLMRNALNQMQYSQQPEGVTASRHPSVTPQYISTFSLWYVAMLHDYMMYGSDVDFVKEKLQSTRNVLEFFKRYQGKDGSLKDVPYWTFTDWVYTDGWTEGIPPMGNDGSSALLDFQLLWAYQVAADIELHLGLKELSDDYKMKAEQLKKTIALKYWDENRQLFADRIEKDLFSQHAGTLAILTGLISGEEAIKTAQKLLTDNTLAPASIYYKFYLHQALTKAGLGNDYLKWLDKWRENMDMGLTTWAETSDIKNTRSDCHAWGSSPNIEFFRIMLGVDSDAPGFAKVKIEPHLGDITEIGGEMPHPNGMIKVKYSVKNNHLIANILLPQNTDGVFVWKGKSYELKTGNNTIKL